MHDISDLERRGIPGVFVASEGFIDAAETQARARNVGWRIDYFGVSNRFVDRVKAATIHPEIHGSDHCPVGLELS